MAFFEGAGGGGAFGYPSACVFVHGSASARLRLRAPEVCGSQIAQLNRATRGDRFGTITFANAINMSRYRVNLSLPDTVHGHRRKVNHSQLWNKYALPLP